MAKSNIDIEYKAGWSDPEDYKVATDYGLTEETVKQISAIKNEPEWMLEFRLDALKKFFEFPNPEWGDDLLREMDFQKIRYYVSYSDRPETDWDDVPDDIKNTFEKLGIPEAEKKFLAGVGAQYDSETVYHKLREDLEKQGVIFVDTDTGLEKHEEYFKKYFGTVVPPDDNKFAALNSAVWSGGSFVVIPAGIKVDIPIQAYFRINTKNAGQFERTLIIAEPGSDVHYIEGCTAPTYTTDSLHSAVVELVALPGAHIRYTTIQNWSNNVYNLVTKRAHAYANSLIEWVDGNIGCLAEGSTITTEHGIKPIEEVIVGEKVLSYDHKNENFCFKEVKAKKYSGEQQVHEVNIGERRIFVTSNHPFFSFKYEKDNPRKLGRYNLVYKRADQLTEAIIPSNSIDYGSPYLLPQLATETTFITSNQYSNGLEVKRKLSSRLMVDEYTNDDLMWFFGLFIGDGNIYRVPGKSGGTRSAKVGFSIPRNNRARNKLLNISSQIIDAKVYERKDGIQLTWNSVELADLIEKSGFGGLARSKRIPDWVLSLPETQRLSFIAGYLDSDGSFNAKDRIFSIKSVNRDLLEDTARVLVTLGITPRIHTEFSESKTVEILNYKSTARGSHRLVFHLHDKIIPYLSKEMQTKCRSAQPARLKHFRKIGRSSIILPPTLEIRKVTVSELSENFVPTWDIEVEDTGNFLTEGFIVHNSKLTMKYPSIYLLGDGAKGDMLSIAYAGDGMHQDTGAKMIHLASNTHSKITAKSISKGNGKTTYRGLVTVSPTAKNVISNVICDALLIDDDSRTDTFPYQEIQRDDATITHEATVGKINSDTLFYLMSRGIPENEALALVVMGFFDEFTRELPMEYAVELNRLIEMEMEGSLG